MPNMLFGWGWVVRKSVKEIFKLTQNKIEDYSYIEHTRACFLLFFVPGFIINSLCAIRAFFAYFFIMTTYKLNG